MSLFDFDFEQDLDVDNQEPSLDVSVAEDIFDVEFDSEDSDLQKDRYIVSSKELEQRVEDGIEILQQIFPLERIDITKIRAFLSKGDLLTCIIYLKIEFVTEQKERRRKSAKKRGIDSNGYSDITAENFTEMLKPFLAFFNKTIDEFMVVLSDQVDINLMLDYLRRELNATDIELNVLKRLWDLKPSEIENLAILEIDLFVEVFTRLSTRKAFPAILYRALMDKAYYLEYLLNTTYRPELKKTVDAPDFPKEM
jgi:hypothetical protein